MNSRGQSVIEFFIMLLAFLLSTVLFLFIGIKAVVPFLQQLDLYDLARAHLYGVESAPCKASSLWPQSIFEVRVDCSHPPLLYVSESKLVWGSLKMSIARIEYNLWKESP